MTPKIVTARFLRYFLAAKSGRKNIHVDKSDETLLLSTTQPQEDHTHKDKDKVDSLRAEVLLAEEQGAASE